MRPPRPFSPAPRISCCRWCPSTDAPLATGSPARSRQRLRAALPAHGARAGDGRRSSLAGTRIRVARCLPKGAIHEARADSIAVGILAPSWHGCAGAEPRVLQQQAPNMPAPKDDAGGEDRARREPRRRQGRRNLERQAGAERRRDPAAGDATPDITVPAPVPDPGTTPVIRPPGSPGGNQRSIRNKPRLGRALRLPIPWPNGAASPSLGPVAARAGSDRPSA